MIEARLARARAEAVLYDAAVPEDDVISALDGSGAAGEPLGERAGRGAVRVLEHGGERWVLRHYRRGGVVARFIEDHYVWLGLERSRSFREWRLLARLAARNLPVPRPVAARVLRKGLLYRADIVTCYLAGTRPLSALLDEGRALDGRWWDIGRMVRAFHDAGVDHPDLTAHNILLDGDGRPHLVDFDNAKVRSPGRWREAGVARLERSLRKVALETGVRFDEAGWRRLLEGYTSA